MYFLQLDLDWMEELILLKIQVPGFTGSKKIGGIGLIDLAPKKDSTLAPNSKLPFVVSFL